MTDVIKETWWNGFKKPKPLFVPHSTGAECHVVIVTEVRSGFFVSLGQHTLDVNDGEASGCVET